MIGEPTPDQIAAVQILDGLNRERDAFLAVHRRVAVEHPEWVANNDARTNLLAKPINHILMAAVNVRLVQQVLGSVDFWRTNVSPDLRTPELVGPPYFEQNTLYRFAFFVFLLSNIEHGFRAIQPQVFRGVDDYADQPFAHVYSSLFRTLLSAEVADKHTNLFDFLRTMRNTIHNNGVYSPINRKDTQFVVEGKTYSFVVGRRVDYFGWEYFIEWLAPIRSALVDVLDAPTLVDVKEITDVASHA